MSAYTEEVLISKLNKLVDTQESISLLSQWFMYHRRHVATSVDIWNRELRKASSARKLSFIYLCNDVCQNSRRKGLEFTQEFKKVLPDAIEHTYRHATADVQGIIRRVVNIWDEREIFDKEFLDELRKRFTGQKNLKSEQRLIQSGHTAPSHPCRPDIAKLTASIQSISESESTVHEYGNKVTKIWSEVMEVEEKPSPSILSQQLDHLLRLLTEHQNLVTKNITNRTQIINQMKEIIAQEEMRLRIDNKSLSDTQSKINETKECIEQLKSISIFRYDAIADRNKTKLNGESRSEPNGEIRQKDQLQQQYARKENEPKSRSIKTIEKSQQLTKVEEVSQGSTSSCYDPSIHLTLPPSSFTSGSLLPSETQLFGDSFSLMNDRLQVPYQTTSISSSISNSPAHSSNSDEYSDPLVSTDHRG
ncbi:8679_t:CDS:2 [Dentiscutata erythropus]|uniref:8679_t:CDS:1 n=1 Tax=Dentiscutata erythropus TaxID=1348616 RepID=A0A9N9N9A6_9GLOM|nr:8679_t:CDS:2 [Dentiscutata erythropus]